MIETLGLITEKTRFFLGLLPEVLFSNFGKMLLQAVVAKNRIEIKKNALMGELQALPRLVLDLHTAYSETHPRPLNRLPWLPPVVFVFHSSALFQNMLKKR